MNGKLLTQLMMYMAALLLVPALAAAQEFDAGPDLEEGKDYYALIITNKGNIAGNLFEDKTPVTVKNFVNLAEGTREWRDPVTRKVVKKPLYNGVMFHRVIPEFMIQTGDPTGSGAGSVGYQIDNEPHPDISFDKPGMFGMANSGPNTNSSQFFITEKSTPHLNSGYTVFGELVPGTNSLEVVKEIARVPRNNRDRPNEPIVIERVQIFRVEPGTAIDDVRQMMENPNKAAEEKTEDKTDEAAEEKKEKPASRPAEHQM